MSASPLQQYFAMLLQERDANKMKIDIVFDDASPRLFKIDTNARGRRKSMNSKTCRWSSSSPSKTICKQKSMRTHKASGYDGDNEDNDARARIRQSFPNCNDKWTSSIHNNKTRYHNMPCLQQSRRSSLPTKSGVPPPPQSRMRKRSSLVDAPMLPPVRTVSISIQPSF